MQPQSQTSELPLVCRPDKSLWVLIVILMAVGLAVAFVPQPTAPPPINSDLWAGVAIVAMFTVPAICTAWHLIHARIVADARGLTFRGFFKSRFVAWSAIEDYELRVPTANQSKSGTPRPYLKSGGKWRLLQPSPTGSLPRQELLERIERDAIAARARNWQVGDLRDDGEWPKHFEYHDSSGWKLVGIYLGMLLLMFSQFFTGAITTGFAPIFANIALIWSGLSPWGRVGFVATPLLLCGSLPLIVLTQYPAIVARRRYLGQKIIATREEISLFRDGRRISLPWSEIESYHLETLPGNFQPNKCVVETQRERIEFLSGITNTKPLLALVQNRAKSATTPKWRHLGGADEDVLGGAKSLYRGGNVGIGPKIHHYRTRTSRIFLIFGAVTLGGFLIPMLTGHLNNGRAASAGDIAVGLFYLVLLGAMTLGGSLAFAFSRLSCEEDGLRQRSFLGERFLRWDEIDKIVFNGYYCRVSGRKRAIRFGLVADYQGLIAEIEKRSGVECKRDGNAV